MSQPIETGVRDVAPGGTGSPRRRFALSTPLLVLGQAVLILATMYLYLRGWRRDFTMPFGFVIDALLYLLQAKGTIDNGWWWSNPMVGAPLGLDLIAYPFNGNVDQAIVWVVSRVVRDPLAAVNFSWLAMVALSGVTATWCMRAIGVSTAAAFVGGTLFALSPYAIYKNLHHFGMAIYLVPFICTIALQLASGRLPERGYGKGAGLGLLVGSGLLGFNYIYYPFFGCFFVAVATIIGFLTFRARRILVAGGLVLVVVVGCTFVNLAPSLYSWSRSGKPIILTDKVPVQAEIYALKIRSLVSPAYGHWFPPFRKWVEKERMSGYPLETENTTSRLGLVGTVGLMGLLCVLLAPTVAARSEVGRMYLGAGQLTVAGLLLATTGGFGALFSLLVTPDIRAYARICPFLAIFALTGVAAAMDAIRWSQRWRLLLAGVVLVIGVADQMPAAAGINGEYPAVTAELPTLKGFVRSIEERLPDRAMVFQLPLRRAFLSETGAFRMQPFDHVKLYLVSRHIRWSYPALSNEQVGWQEAAARLPLPQLPPQMAAEGFAAIVVDRYGYQDNGEAATAAIRAAVGDGQVIAETERYVAFDIRSLAGRTSLARLPTRPGAMTIGMSACPGQTATSLERAGRARAPFPAGVAAVKGSRPLKITGWGVDLPGGSAGAGMDVVVDGTPLPTFYAFDREDVARHFGQPVYYHSGFTTELAPNSVPPGEHKLSLRVVAANGQCYYEGASVTLVIR